MAKQKPNVKNLNSNLKRLSEITNWFENQEEVDIEEGLKKVKEAAIIIKASKKRLKAIENEFEEIKKEATLEEDGGKDNSGGGKINKNDIGSQNIPF